MSFKTELAKLKGYLSTWVAGAGAAVVIGYQSLPPQMVSWLHEIVASNPSLKWATPLVWFLAWCAARAAPQGSALPPPGEGPQE